MSALDLAVAAIEKDEGFRANIYTDTTGHKTIGYGANLDAGITQSAALALLDAQCIEIASSLSALDWFKTLDDVRAAACINAAFNLGLHGFLQFQRTIQALRSGNWQGAHDALLDSAAARMLPVRYGRLALELLTGVT